MPSSLASAATGGVDATVSLGLKCRVSAKTSEDLKKVIDLCMKSLEDYELDIEGATIQVVQIGRTTRKMEVEFTQ